MANVWPKPASATLAQIEQSSKATGPVAAAMLAAAARATQIPEGRKP